MRVPFPLASRFLAAMVVLVCVSAAPGGTGKLETDPATLLQVKVLIKELEFTADQQKKLEQIVRDLKKAITRWDAENRVEYAEIRRDYSASLRSGSSSKMRRAMAARKALDRRRRYVVDSHMRRVCRLFTPEQEAAWEGHKLHVEMYDRYKRWRLTSKQIEQLKNSCYAVGGMIADLDKRGDMEGLMRTRVSLQRYIVANIFTEAQRKKIEAPAPASKEAREAAERRKAEAQIAFQAVVQKQEIKEAYRTLKVTQEMADVMVAHNIKMAEEIRKNWNKKNRNRPGRDDDDKRKRERERERRERERERRR